MFTREERFVGERQREEFVDRNWPLWWAHLRGECIEGCSLCQRMREKHGID